MNWEGTRVLVTGAGGFIGSHLTEELVRRGARVTALAKYNANSSWGNLELLPAEVQADLRVELGDIRDPFLMRRLVEGQDVVIHLAALIGIPFSYVAPHSYVETNIAGTLNLLEACKLHDARMVHTSTSETYGTARYTPMDEQHPLQGQSPYSASKIGADKMAESYYLSFRTRVSTLRPFNTFGPRQSARAIIPTIVSQIAAGQSRIKLGSLSPVRDLLFVKDTVAAFVAMAERDDTLGQVVHVGTGRGVTMGDLAALIAKLMGVDAIFETEEARVRPEHSEVMELICNPDRARRLLGWEPRHTLEEGLAETIAAVREQLGRYSVGRYAV
ncbi:MAG: GDP-mannose 4,6-dehydratase [Candidatus Sericytochromatia bacterium]|nr:GDP-mannose 4,6-dehydratase [Candidatus Tanganyikabacteria bacterium]